ncbi:hypothetical protein [Argonema antarcticum]|uniref:hypothetical protein n=1 Tax=Argonema antarcticum TaxID=2942763 RepID=UPI0020135EE7|nr:hypothetical protein [Argonema antarcticum]MCL1473959.1 hypothetical protein [Argonema antarcticum A004/B2]
MSNLIYPHLFLFTYYLKTSPASQEDSDKPEVSRFPDGFSSRRTLGDTDSLLLACSVSDNDDPRDNLPFLELKDKLTTETEKLSISGELLGKTWMIFGYSPAENTEYIAKAAYESLNFGKWGDRESGQFSEAKIWEIWQTPQNWQNLQTENNHILIIIYPDLTAMGNSANFYEDWRQLFCYKHKIAWAYGKTRQLKPTLAKHFAPEVQSIAPFETTSSQLNLLESELTELTKALDKNYQILQEYAEGIAYLEVQMQALKTNAYNYQERLQNIERKANKITPTKSANLDILKTFNDLVKYKYQAQLEQDNAALSPGLRLREKQIDTIRGIVEIRQAQLDDIIEKRDRIFQETVQEWGIGIGVAAIAATSISPFIPNITKNKLTEPFPALEGVINFSLTFILSIIIGIVAKNKAKKLIKSHRS